MGRGRNSINELITLLSETFICEQFIFHFPFRESHPPTPTRTNSVKVSELCSTLFGNSFRILSLSSVSVLSVSILYLNSGLWPINQLQLIRRGRWHVVVVVRGSKKFKEATLSYTYGSLFVVQVVGLDGWTSGRRNGVQI